MDDLDLDLIFNFDDDELAFNFEIFDKPHNQKSLFSLKLESIVEADDFYIDESILEDLENDNYQKEIKK